MKCTYIDGILPFITEVIDDTDKNEETLTLLLVGCFKRDIFFITYIYIPIGNYSWNINKCIMFLLIIYIYI